MMYRREHNVLIAQEGNTTVYIQPWGANALRVQMTKEQQLDSNTWALSEPAAGTELSPGTELPVSAQMPSITIQEISFSQPWLKHYPEAQKNIERAYIASITNGKITASFNHEGWLTFTNDKDEVLLKEFWRNRSRIDRYCIPLNLSGRELKPVKGTSDWELTARFEAFEDEKIFGLGQYQDEFLNKKGLVLDLCQKNSQSSVPFMLSSRGYGFLWNNPAIGRVNFANNITEWYAQSTKKMDYWVTAGDTPQQIMEQYTSVTGRTPQLPSFASGFWQCKLRYKNQEEVLSVAREYKRRNLPLSVIVIDFFHWTMQGDFEFDPVDWPDPASMVKELEEMGIILMVSVWPTIDERSKNFGIMAQNGHLVSFERGSGVHMSWMGNTVFFDATHPEARKFVWETCDKNYGKYGIKHYWLDEAEPEYGIYDFDQFRYAAGPALQVSNSYPWYFAKAFFEGQSSSGQTDILNLVRCAWAGSQKYGALVWSGDIHSSFRAMREQLQAGLNMGLAGIPWWTTDIGGFLGGDIHDPEFQELIIRWFQWGAFCPVMRLHGERPPFEDLGDQEYRGQVRQMPSGQANEVWSFGDRAYEIMQKFLLLREKLRPYIHTLMEEAHIKGNPVMRTMFYEFPDDDKCWNCTDQYMLGSKILVAPVMEKEIGKRKVYLPKTSSTDTWTHLFTGEKFKAGQTIEEVCPLETLPVYYRGENPLA